MFHLSHLDAWQNALTQYTHRLNRIPVLSFIAQVLFSNLWLFWLTFHPPTITPSFLSMHSSFPRFVKVIDWFSVRLFGFWMSSVGSFIVIHYTKKVESLLNVFTKYLKYMFSSTLQAATWAASDSRRHQPRLGSRACPKHRLFSLQPPAPFSCLFSPAA